jgi:hypothetical protein
MADLLDVREALRAQGQSDLVELIEVHLAHDVEREREAVREVRRLVQEKADLQSELKAARARIAEADPLKQPPPPEG